MQEDKYIISKRTDGSGTLTVFAVQMRYLYRYITIKQFTATTADADELWRAEAQALNLLDELNK